MTAVAPIPDAYIAQNITNNEILDLSCSPAIDLCLPLNPSRPDDIYRTITYNPNIDIPLMVLMSVDRIHDFGVARGKGKCRIKNVNNIAFKWLEDWYNIHGGEPGSTMKNLVFIKVKKKDGELDPVNNNHVTDPVVLKKKATKLQKIFDYKTGVESGDTIDIYIGYRRFALRRLGGGTIIKPILLYSYTIPTLYQKQAPINIDDITITNTNEVLVEGKVFNFDAPNQIFKIKKIADQIKPKRGEGRELYWKAHQDAAKLNIIYGKKAKNLVIDAPSLRKHFHERVVGLPPSAQPWNPVEKDSISFISDYVDAAKGIGKDIRGWAVYSIPLVYTPLQDEQRPELIYVDIRKENNEDSDHDENVSIAFKKKGRDVPSDAAEEWIHIKPKKMVGEQTICQFIELEINPGWSGCWGSLTSTIKKMISRNQQPEIDPNVTADNQFLRNAARQICRVSDVPVNKKNRKWYVEALMAIKTFGDQSRLCDAKLFGCLLVSNDTFLGMMVKSTEVKFIQDHKKQAGANFKAITVFCPRVSATDVPTTTEDTTITASAAGVPASATDVDTITASAAGVPASATDVPASATDVPASATDVPASATDVPASATDVPASATDVPASATDVPASATDVRRPWYRRGWRQRGGQTLSPRALIEHMMPGIKGTFTDAVNDQSRLNDEFLRAVEEVLTTLNSILAENNMVVEAAPRGKTPRRDPDVTPTSVEEEDVSANLKRRERIERISYDRSTYTQANFLLLYYVYVICLYKQIQWNVFMKKLSTSIPDSIDDYIDLVAKYPYIDALSIENLINQMTDVISVIKDSIPSRGGKKRKRTSKSLLDPDVLTELYNALNIDFEDIISGFDNVLFSTDSIDIERSFLPLQRIVDHMQTELELTLNMEPSMNDYPLGQYSAISIPGYWAYKNQIDVYLNIFKVNANELLTLPTTEDTETDSERDDASMEFDVGNSLNVVIGPDQTIDKFMSQLAEYYANFTDIDKLKEIAGLLVMTKTDRNEEQQDTLDSYIQQLRYFIYYVDMFQSIDDSKTRYGEQEEEEDESPTPPSEPLPSGTPLTEVLAKTIYDNNELYRTALGNIKQEELIQDIFKEYTDIVMNSVAAQATQQQQIMKQTEKVLMDWWADGNSAIDDPSDPVEEKNIWDTALRTLSLANQNVLREAAEISIRGGWSEEFFYRIFHDSRGPWAAARIRSEKHLLSPGVYQGQTSTQQSEQSSFRPSQASSETSSPISTPFGTPLTAPLGESSNRLPLTPIKESDKTDSTTPPRGAGIGGSKKQTRKKKTNKRTTRKRYKKKRPSRRKRRQRKTNKRKQKRSTRKRFKKGTK